MKKRDLTKLVLTGMAAGSIIAAQPLQANELEGPVNIVEGNLLAHGCKNGCGGQRPPQYNSNPYQPHYVEADNQGNQPGMTPSGQDPSQPSQGNQPYYYHNNQTAQPDQSQRYPSQGRYLASADEDQEEGDILLALDEEEDNLYASDEDSDSNDDQDHELLFADENEESSDESDIIA